MCYSGPVLSCFFFNDTAPTETYTYLHTLSLHDALPIYSDRRQAMQVACDSRTLNTDLEIKVLTTAMAAAQQAAQHAVTAARTSYEKVTGSPFQDIGRLDDYAADVEIGRAHV